MGRPVRRPVRPRRSAPAFRPARPTAAPAQCAQGIDRSEQDKQIKTGKKTWPIITGPNEQDKKPGQKEQEKIDSFILLIS